MALQHIGFRAALLALATLAACSDDRLESEKSGADPGDLPTKDAASGDDRGQDTFDNVAIDAGKATPADAGGTDGANGDPTGGTTLPTFPGAGTSNASDPLPNGMLCDSVAGAVTPIPERIEECHFDKNAPGAMTPAATLEQVLECVEGTDTVHIRLTFHPWFVDNTYGENSVNWHTRRPAPAGKMNKPRTGGHSFDDLLESDHAEIILKDASGAVVMQLKLDYISADPTRPSGYGSLGVLGGEGEMIIGDAADVVRWMSSEDRNLNERGYASYIVDSPATDDNFTANPATPEWDYRVVYEAWIALRAFGGAGFGGATIEYVHASPSKAASNTIETEPGECPPCQDPDGCHEDPPPPPPPCGSSDPDAVCSDAGIPDDNGGMPVPEPVM
jgi:hypothetical protein